MRKFEKVKRFSGIDIEAPIRKTERAACYDMVAAEDVVIQPYNPLMEALGAMLVQERITPEVQTMAQKVQDVQGADAVNQLVNSLLTCTTDEVAQLTKATGIKPTLISTGYKAYMEEDESLDLYIRSSSPLKYWLIMANSTGIIDGDYADNPDNEGEIFFQVINLLPFPIKIRKGEIIGQAKFTKFGVTDDDSSQEKAERQGGFGSTTVESEPNDWISEESAQIQEHGIDDEASW